MPDAEPVTVHDEIVAILSKETGIEPDRLAPEATIHDLGIQSIDLVQAIFAIETRFDIEIPVGPEQDGGDVTVGDFIRHVLARIDPDGAGHVPAHAH